MELLSHFLHLNPALNLQMVATSFQTINGAELIHYIAEAINNVTQHIFMLNITARIRLQIPFPIKMHCRKRQVTQKRMAVIMWRWQYSTVSNE